MNTTVILFILAEQAPTAQSFCHYCCSSYIEGEYLSFSESHCSSSNETLYYTYMEEE